MRLKSSASSIKASRLTDCLSKHSAKKINNPKISKRQNPLPLLTFFFNPCIWLTDLGALYVVVQVVPEGVDEVDGVVSGIGIGVTWEQD